jgi:hypothetical protein
MGDDLSGSEEEPALQLDARETEIQRLTSVLELLSVKLLQLADPTSIASHLLHPYVLASSLLALLASFNAIPGIRTTLISYSSCILISLFRWRARFLEASYN